VTIAKATSLISETTPIGSSHSPSLPPNNPVVR
jgi:hypothetical protein